MDDIAVYHILPINDIYEHEESSMCHCNPEVREVEGGVLVIHNAFDKRERKEELLEQINQN